MPEPENHASSAASAPPFEPDEGWVPADERLFGLDRRTIAPTLAVFALVVLMSVVLPAINAKVPYRDITKGGDVIELAGDVTFVPPVGWGISAGVRADHPPLSGAYPATAVVEDGATQFKMHTAPFHGDPDALLDQIVTTADALNRGRGIHVTGPHTTVVTDQGARGVTALITGPHVGGVVAAFVFGGLGVEAVATGPADIGPQQAAAVTQMIRSIRHPKAGKP